MKILHISTSDICGGAARAAYRIHKGLQDIQIESRMLVASKQSDDWSILSPRSKAGKAIALIKPALEDTILTLCYGKPASLFSPAWFPILNLYDTINRFLPDIIHLHWVCGGMLRLEQLGKIDKPIVWTLHDMWPFTGGCHYNQTCSGYENSCCFCPQLNRNGPHNLSQSVISRKKKSWRDINLTIVSPSHWMAECATKSDLFRDRDIRVIHNGLNLDIFKPIDKIAARNAWGFPTEKRLILFGSLQPDSDIRKGFDLLHECLKVIPNRYIDDFELVVCGAIKPKSSPFFPLPTHYVGRLNDDISLAMLYSAADITVIPSRQDNLPNMVAESLSCGTPVAAFRIGGIPDMIDHQHNGYLAMPYNIADLAKGINWVLEDKTIHKKLCLSAREKALSCFDIKKITKQYNELFKNIK